ncbi:hypothetical protein ACFSCX_19255 [Bacillus salitolerans]|uniref:Uncharacterized protein n=1 Tax=Bacillus salitolerans TaxID=1437434 RepID=A0ABW4LUD3_9BACI
MVEVQTNWKKENGESQQVILRAYVISTEKELKITRFETVDQ